MAFIYHYYHNISIYLLNLRLTFNAASILDATIVRPWPRCSLPSDNKKEHLYKFGLAIGVVWNGINGGGVLSLLGGGGILDIMWMELFGVQFIKVGPFIKGWNWELAG